MHFRCLMAAILVAAPAFSQLTPEQRQFDFQSLANLFAKFYAPYEWKRDNFAFDLYDVRPWQQRIAAAKDDLAAMEIMSEYVASLRDSHSGLSSFSNYVASIPFQVDIYDGKYLIESIDRTNLPASTFPAEVGDELVSFDGRTPEQIVADFMRFEGNADERAGRRWSATRITRRPQAVIPRAHEHGPTAAVQVRHQDGRVATYNLTWIERGTPLVKGGPIPTPNSRGLAMAGLAAKKAGAGKQDATRSDALPFFKAYHNRSVLNRLAGFSARNPYYGLPDGFQMRLGRRAADFHFSGTYMSGGKRIGLIRIPHFSPDDPDTAINELFAEMLFLKANTDGLVLDISRNGGGDCYATDVLQLFIPYKYELPGDETRPSLTMIQEIDAEVETAKALRFPDWVIALLQNIGDQMRAAIKENRGRTGPLPACSITFDWDPLTDSRGNLLAYDKPILLLIDENSYSFADSFAATMQDSGRATLFGYKTNGAGGFVLDFFNGVYTETGASFSGSLGVRRKSVFTSEYGNSNVLENAGARPDVYYDYMTRENLLQRGKPFVDAFTKTMLDILNGR